LRPIQEEHHFGLHSATVHREHQAITDRTSMPIHGVRGESLVSSNITLPIHAPFDVMHLIYLYVGKTLLRRIVGNHLLDNVL